MTVRGLQLLHDADVVVYDQLVNDLLLDEAPAAARRIFVGKQAGRHSIAQSDINEVLINYALQGHRVVRLKGGDPFVFGRGGEEAEALADAGIPFEIVPGVSSAVAVPAYAGIPLTHETTPRRSPWSPGTRRSNPSLRSIGPSSPRAVDTLVILMGLHNLPAIVAKLVAHGRAPETPAAVIQQGTTEQQKTVVGTLADIVEKSAAMKAPALIIVGEVVGLKEKLNWFDLDSVQDHRDPSSEDERPLRL